MLVVVPEFYLRDVDVVVGDSCLRNTKSIPSGCWRKFGTTDQRKRRSCLSWSCTITGIPCASPMGSNVHTSLELLFLGMR